MSTTLDQMPEFHLISIPQITKYYFPNLIYRDQDQNLRFIKMFVLPFGNLTSYGKRSFK